MTFRLLCENVTTLKPFLYRYFLAQVIQVPNIRAPWVRSRTPGEKKSWLSIDSSWFPWKCAGHVLQQTYISNTINNELSLFYVSLISVELTWFKTLYISLAGGRCQVSEKAKKLRHSWKMTGSNLQLDKPTRTVILFFSLLFIVPKLNNDSLTSKTLIRSIYQLSYEGYFNVILCLLMQNLVLPQLPPPLTVKQSFGLIFCSGW